MTNGHRRIFAGTELAARIERAERSLIGIAHHGCVRERPISRKGFPYGDVRHSSASFQ